MFRLIGISDPQKLEPYLQKIVSWFDRSAESLELALWHRTSESTKAGGVIFSYEPTGSVSKLFGYFLWVLSIIKYLYRNCDSNDVILASRFDVGFAVWGFSFFSRIKFVYLDRDAAHLVVQNSALAFVVKFFEKRIAKRAVVHVIPISQRDYTGFSNVVVLPNSPSLDLLARADSVSLCKFGLNRSKFLVYVNGWLVESRGGRMILEAAKKLQVTSPHVEFVLAGELESTFSQELATLPNVCFVGRLASYEALALYREVQVVLSFYDPNRKINALAAPNKWMDCLAFGVPFVTNKSILTVKDFMDSGLCHVVAYDDPVELALLLHKLACQKVPMTINLEELRARYDWDLQFTKVMGSIDV